MLPPGRLETLYAQRLEDAYERLAYHYARTDNVAKAVAYLTRVAEKAARHSAHVEAISHLTQALELLQRLPATPERSQQELTLHIALGASLLATKGYGAPRWHRPTPTPGSSVSTWTTLSRVSRCCVDCGIIIRARRAPDGARPGRAAPGPGAASPGPRDARGGPPCPGDDVVPPGSAAASAHTHLAQGMALYDPQQHRASAFLYGEDAGVICHRYAAWACGTWAILTRGWRGTRRL